MDGRMRFHYLRSFLALDTTDCPIQRPSKEIQRAFYSGKSKKHCLKYEIGVSLVTGQIHWIWGPVGGATHDVTISESSGITHELRPNEYIFADKAYSGQPYFITPIKSPQTYSDQIYNGIVSSLRQIVENLLDRLKNFECLNTNWRHDLHLHPIAFKVVCNLVNIDIQFRPLRNLN
jgi:hypothetical protein